MSKTGAAFRKARADDIAALLKIENQSFGADRISRRSFRTFINRSSTASVVVAETNGRILGYAILLFRRGTALARLYSIAVDGEARGKGIARGLLCEAEARAFELGRMLIRLEVRKENARAIDLYRRAGYRPIGEYLDYYSDNSAALRFEKTVRGTTPLDSVTPYFAQTTDFTCGPACLMMALARFEPGYLPDPVKEIRLWREATTVFMMSGIGGCEPYGLAVAAHEAGLGAELWVSQPGVLFTDSVRNPEKREVMRLAQLDFRRRTRAYSIPVHSVPFPLAAITDAIHDGHVAIVLVSGYHMYGKKVPHWVLAHDDVGGHILIHDPWVERDNGETLADAANLPVPYEHFFKMSRFGKQELRAAVILKNKNG